jgi:transposase
LLWFVTAVAGVLAEAGADAGLRDVLAQALEANERWEQLAAELRAENAQQREENAGLREALAQRDAQVEQMAAELAVLRRLVFGRSSERERPEAGRDEAAAGIGPTGIAWAAVIAAGRAGRGRGGPAGCRRHETVTRRHGCD